MLDKPICHFRGDESILLLLLNFLWKILLENNVNLVQMPHYVTSDLGLHCLPMPFYRFPGKTGLIVDPSYEGKQK